jgi:L-aspartate oxidase
MNPDFLVIGAGVAGLRAAVELSQAGSVLVIAKDTLRESNSEYAQGGIAVALSDDDEVELHEQDTLYAGDGLCDLEAVRTLVEEGPAAIQDLIDWGVQFDREGAKLAFGREGAHSRNRVLHAHGDSTGREIARTLQQKAASLTGVMFQSYAATVDLLMEDGRVTGAQVFDDRARARRTSSNRWSGPRLQGDDESRRRHPITGGDGVARGCRNQQYRVRSIPSDGTAPGWCAALSVIRSFARRRRDVDQRRG